VFNIEPVTATQPTATDYLIRQHGCTPLEGSQAEADAKEKAKAPEGVPISEK
jgi:hypothetical protein